MIKEDSLGNLHAMSFAIDLDGELVGSIGFGQIDGHSGKIGYWITEDCWGQGRMTRALEMFSKYAFNELKFKRLYAHVIDFNKGSQRVLEKAGFKLEGIMKKHYNEGGKFHDGFLYAKVK